MVIQKLGRISFSIATSGLGISNLLVSNFQAVRVFDSWIIIIYAIIEFLFWTGLVVFSLGITFSNRPQLSAVWMARVISIWILARQVPPLVSDFSDAAQWNFACMALATCGGAFVVAGSFENIDNNRRESAVRFSQYILAGKVLLAFALLVLGLQHILYAEFIASMIPSWISEKIGWAWMTGIALIATGVSFFANIKIRWSSLAFYAMILFWISLLHVPRIIARPQDLYEWIYAFQALTIGSSALILYGIQIKSVLPTRNQNPALPKADFTVINLKSKASKTNVSTLTDHFEKHPTSRGRKSFSFREMSSKR